jgi:hypothetical protein
VNNLTYDLIREISMKHQHSVCGLFEQGSRQRELGEVVVPTSMAVNTILFSLI